LVWEDGGPGAAVMAVSRGLRRVEQAG